jgi:hypothetical protein
MLSTYEYIQLNCYCKVEKVKSPGSEQIPTELIQARGETLLFAIHKLINSIWNKEELPLWKESIIVTVHHFSSSPLKHDK